MFRLEPLKKSIHRVVKGTHSLLVFLGGNLGQHTECYWFDSGDAVPDRFGQIVGERSQRILGNCCFLWIQYIVRVEQFLAFLVSDGWCFEGGERIYLFVEHGEEVSRVLEDYSFG